MTNSKKGKAEPKPEPELLLVISCVLNIERGTDYNIVAREVHSAVKTYLKRKLEKLDCYGGVGDKYLLKSDVINLIEGGRR